MMGLTPIPVVASSPFDALAERYDDVFTSSTIGQAQRAAVWKELKKTFRKGDRILDIGCGTGVDACFLSDHGIHVIACDSSSRMLDVALKRIAALTQFGDKGSVQLRLLSVEEIATLKNEGTFDGAFSNFGALNCIENLSPLARDLAVLLKPGASLALCLMGPLCLWEMAWYWFHGDRAKAFRRLHREGVDAQLGDGHTVHVQYPRVPFLKRIFAPEFRLENITGIGVMVPPSYLEAWANRNPRVADLAVLADRLLGRCPGIRMLADHVLLKFERTSA